MGLPYDCLSNLGGSGLSCDLTSLMDLRRAADFSVCLAFYLLSRWSDNFQPPCMLDWQLEPLVQTISDSAASPSSDIINQVLSNITWAQHTQGHSLLYSLRVLSLLP